MGPLFSRMFAGALFAVALFQSECLAQGQDSGANPKAPVPPTLPSAPSPIQYFRRLLDAPATERERLLAGKTPDQRRVLTNSVRIYMALSPEDRELRLRAMELRYYLTPLMQLPATNRALGLQLVPESYRARVQERLEYFDRLTPEMRQQLVERGILTAVQPTLSHPVPGYTSNQLAKLDAAVKQWRLASEAKRSEIASNFARLYQVPAEKDKTLGTLPLPDAERVQIEKTIEKFSKMQPLEHQLVVKSFSKFTNLSPEESRQFLRNAEAWRKMSPEDRQRWRSLVNNAPPLPPLTAGFARQQMLQLPKIPPTPPRSAILSSNEGGF